MFRIIKVIYAHCGKFTMSIKLQRAGKEQVTNQHEWFESTCIKRFYIFIKTGRDRQEQRRVRSVLEKMSTDVLAVALPCVAAFHDFFLLSLTFSLMLLELT